VDSSEPCKKWFVHHVIIYAMGCSAENADQCASQEHPTLPCAMVRSMSIHFSLALICQNQWPQWAREKVKEIKQLICFGVFLIMAVYALVWDGMNTGLICSIALLPVVARNSFKKHYYIGDSRFSLLGRRKSENLLLGDQTCPFSRLFIPFNWPCSPFN